MDEKLKIMHKITWDAIDKIARENGITVSRLARLSGLDPTAFNRSKRMNFDKRGNPKERFLSVESISRVLITMNLTWKDFARMIKEEEE